MNTKLKTSVKTHLKSLMKKGSGRRAFYFITNGERPLLYISSQDGEASMYGDVAKINKHIARKKYGEAYPSDAAALAGVMVLKDRTLNFSVKLKKNGASATMLKNGIRSVKSALQIKRYAIADVSEEGEEPRSPKKRTRKKADPSRAEARLEKIRRDAAVFEQDPGALSDQQLARLRERLERMPDEDFGDLPQQLAAEAARRAVQAKRIKQLQVAIASFQADPSALSDKRLAQLRGRLMKMSEAADFGAALEQVSAERKRRKRLQQVREASQIILEGVEPLEAETSSALSSDAVTLDALDALLGRLQASQAGLSRQRGRLQKLIPS